MMPGIARFHGKGMGGGAAASSSTRSMTEARKPEEGISSGSFAIMLSISSFISDPLSIAQTRKLAAGLSVFQVRESLSQQCPGAGQARLHSALRQAQVAGGGGDVHLMKVEQNQRLAIALRQRQHGAP